MRAGRAGSGWRGACYGWGMQWVKWALVATGLATTSCAGLAGAGAAAVVITAGIVSYTCYDRVSVTVTNRVTGRSLCDAKVSFFEAKSDSETEATSCYQAALAPGKYRLHVERPGLVPFNEPVVVTRGRECGQSVQTIYVAMDRVQKAPSEAVTAPDVVLPPVNGTVTKAAPSAAATPSPVPVAPSAAPAPSAVPAAPSAVPVAPPPAATTPPAAAPPSAAGTFPTAP